MKFSFWESRLACGLRLFCCEFLIFYEVMLSSDIYLRHKKKPCGSEVPRWKPKARSVQAPARLGPLTTRSHHCTWRDRLYSFPLPFGHLFTQRVPWSGNPLSCAGLLATPLPLLSALMGGRSQWAHPLSTRAQQHRATSRATLNAPVDSQTRVCVRSMAGLLKSDCWAPSREQGPGMCISSKSPGGAGTVGPHATPGGAALRTASRFSGGVLEKSCSHAWHLKAPSRLGPLTSLCWLPSPRG